MVYLSYRFEKAGIENLDNVYIKEIEKDWIFFQISDEIKDIFPDAKVYRLNSISKKHKIDLVIYPYEGPDFYGLRGLYNFLIKIYKPHPTYIMFYGIDHRNISIFTLRTSWKWYLRVLLENSVAKVSYYLHRFQVRIKH